MSARIEQLRELLAELNLEFSDFNLLDRALTHRSFQNESLNSELGDNETLEFLGDAVVGLIVAEMLFSIYPDYQEGEMAALKAQAVSEQSLFPMAQELNLGRYLNMGKGEENSGGRERTSILANTMESFLGAIYLDAGLDAVRRFARPLFENRFEDLLSRSAVKDPKTRLQELIQGKYKSVPLYEVVKENGPDHDKVFISQVSINGQVYGTAEGKSKKESEIAAAAVALEKLI
jgi:ribonuclease III